MPGFSALLSVLGGPIAAEAAKIALVALIVAVVFQGVRLVGADARLEHARRRTIEVADEREHALAELAVTRDKVDRLERDMADQDESIRTSMAAVDRRLAEAQHAVDRAEAAAIAHEARVKALLVADPRAGESRCKTATRLITEVLARQRS